jgi:hypothetical protein
MTGPNRDGHPRIMTAPELLAARFPDEPDDPEVAADLSALEAQAEANDPRASSLTWVSRTDAEKPALLRDAADRRSRLQESLERVGAKGPADYLEMVGAEPRARGSWRRHERPLGCPPVAAAHGGASRSAARVQRGHPAGRRHGPAGPPKVGKTLWIPQTALESGRPCLLVLREGSLAGIVYRLSRQADALGVTDPPILVMHRQRARLDARRSDQLRAIVAAERPALVALDPLNRLPWADENRPSQMTSVMDAMAGIAYDFGCAVLAVHRLAKPSAKRRGDIWDRYRGASSIRSGTDANLALDGSGDRVRLVGELRDAEPLSEWLELDREALLFRPADAPEAPSKVDAIALRAFVEGRRQVTAQAVMDEFRVTKNTALRALRALGCDEDAGGPSDPDVLPGHRAMTVQRLCNAQPKDPVRAVHDRAVNRALKSARRTVNGRGPGTAARSTVDRAALTAPRSRSRKADLAALLPIRLAPEHGGKRHGSHQTDANDGDHGGGTGVDDIQEQQRCRGERNQQPAERSQHAQEPYPLHGP